MNEVRTEAQAQGLSQYQTIMEENEKQWQEEVYEDLKATYGDIARSGLLDGKLLRTLVGEDGKPKAY